MSYYCARHLQLETGMPYRKDLTNGELAWNIPYEKAPPTRLLALDLILSYWLGWIDAVGGHHLDTEPVAAWKRIEAAYNKGKEKGSKDRAAAANTKSEGTS